MATSGTAGTTTLDVSDIIDHAARRCGVMPADLNPENVKLMKDNLFMLLSTLANRGINMWRIERTLIGVYVGQANYDTPVGTQDVLEALWRQPQRLSADTVTSSAGGTTSYVDDGDIDTSLTQVSTNGNVVFDFGTSATVNCIGLLPNTTQTYNLVLEVSQDNISWTTVKSYGSTVMTNSEWTWSDLEPAQAGQYFRVRETGGATINFREIYLANTWTETSMWRMNRDDYSMLPNKRSTGNPLQFWFNRQISSQQLVVWQIPTNTFTLISLWLHMQIEDVGAMSNDLDIPQRWYDAVVANLAWNSILDLPKADMTRAPLLEKQAMSTMMTAEMEERDASPTNITANISAYT